MDTPVGVLKGGLHCFGWGHAQPASIPAWQDNPDNVTVFRELVHEGIVKPRFVEVSQFDFIHPTGLWTIDDCGLEVGQEACDIGSLRVICKGDERCSTISRCPCGQPIGRRAREQDRDECRLDEDKQNHGKSGPLRAKGWMDPEELAKLCEAAMAARRGATRQ